MSMVYLGYAYRVLNRGPSDILESKRWYDKAAEVGALRAQFGLGRWYLKKGYFTEAQQAFEIAAKGDFVPAIHYLGRIYFFGQGVPKDIAKATSLLERAVADGSIYARRILGRIFIQNSEHLLNKARGFWLIGSGAVLLIWVMMVEGFASDRLR